MRTILALLILGNLLLFALGQMQGPTPKTSVLASPPNPPGVLRLQLLSERQAEPAPPADLPVEQPAEMPAEAAAEAPATTPAEQEPTPEQVAEVEAPPEPVCHTIGSFDEQGAAATLVAALQARDISAGVRASEIQEPAGYWVYLPAMPKDRADAIARELVEQGVEDYFIGRQNYISLGIYSDKETAENRVAEIAALGYQPQQEVRFRVRAIYWVDAEETGQPLTVEEWREVLAGYSGIRRQTLVCE